MGDLILNPNQYDRILEGVLVTLRVLGASFLLGTVVSLVVGIARLSERAWIRGLALVYVELFRGISTIVLLFWMAIAVPILLGIPQRSLLVLSAIALGINMGGYGQHANRDSDRSLDARRLMVPTSIASAALLRAPGRPGVARCRLRGRRRW